MAFLIAWIAVCLAGSILIVLWTRSRSVTVESGTACTVAGLAGSSKATVAHAGDTWMLRSNLELLLGERVRVEVPSRNGVRAYSGEVVSCLSGLVELRDVAHLASEDRRQYRRVALRAPATLDSAEAELLDVSECGARLRCAELPKRGERVMLGCTAVSDQALGAWVLESTPEQIRVRFEDLLPLT